MDNDKTRRDSPAITDEKEKAPPRDRDQAAYSPERAQEVADRAEFSKTPGAQKKPDSDEALTARDNMKGTPPRSGSS